MFENSFNFIMFVSNSISYNYKKISFFSHSLFLFYSFLKVSFFQFFDNSNKYFLCVIDFTLFSSFSVKLYLLSLNNLVHF